MLNLPKKSLQIDNMVKRSMGEHHVIRMGLNIDEVKVRSAELYCQIFSDTSCLRWAIQLIIDIRANNIVGHL